MWIVRECTVKLHDVDVLLLLMLSAILATASLCLVANAAPRMIWLMCQ